MHLIICINIIDIDILEKKYNKAQQVVPAETAKSAVSAELHVNCKEITEI